MLYVNAFSLIIYFSWQSKGHFGYSSLQADINIGFKNGIACNSLTCFSIKILLNRIVVKILSSVKRSSILIVSKHLR